MANVQILSNLVQGVPALVLLDGTTSIVSHSSSVTVVNALGKYFFAGSLTDSANLGNQTTLDTLLALGVIAYVDTPLIARAKMTITLPVYSSVSLKTTSGLNPGVTIGSRIAAGSSGGTA